MIHVAAFFVGSITIVAFVLACILLVGLLTQAEHYLRKIQWFKWWSDLWLVVLLLGFAAALLVLNYLIGARLLGVI